MEKNDPKWEHHMKHLDVLFGKAEKCNEDLDRRNRCSQFSAKSKSKLKVGMKQVQTFRYTVNESETFLKAASVDVT